jgi:hypothetical protein
MELYYVLFSDGRGAYKASILAHHTPPFADEYETLLALASDGYETYEEALKLAAEFNALARVSSFGEPL